MKIFLCNLILLIFTFSCQNSEPDGWLFQQRMIPGKGEQTVWINPADTRDWHGIIVDSSKNEISLMNVIDSKFEGRQVYWRLDTRIINSIDNYHAGVADGKAYSFYSSGRLRGIITFCGVGIKRCGNMYRFLDKDICNFDTMQEYLLVNGKEARNGFYKFDPQTCKPIRDSCRWSVRTESLSDSIALGDTLFFTVQVRFPAPWHKSTMVLFDDHSREGVFTANGSTVKAAYLPSKRGTDSLMGKVLSCANLPSKISHDSILNCKELYFIHNFFVR